MSSSVHCLLQKMPDLISATSDSKPTVSYVVNKTVPLSLEDSSEMT